MGHAERGVSEGEELCGTRSPSELPGNACKGEAASLRLEGSGAGGYLCSLK